MSSKTVNGYEIENGEIVGPESREEKLENEKKESKKQECRQTILSLYSATDQINVLRSGRQNEIDVMNAKIDAILNEWRKNGKNADFSSFKQ